MQDYKININFIDEILSKSVQNNYGNICIFTDIDGTLTLSPMFKHAIIRTKTNLGNNIFFIANTGRTPKEIEEILNEKNISIKVFDDVLGNNGATSKYLESCIPQDTVNNILNEFVKNGGEVEDIRFVAEDDIYIQDNDAAHEYYENRKIKSAKDIIGEANNKKINKITLIGNDKSIQNIIKYIQQKGYKCNTHEGNSTYRSNRKGTYRRRVDITSDECSKAIILRTSNTKIKSKNFCSNGK